jgi:hypothetical protein
MFVSSPLADGVMSIFARYGVERAALGQGVLSVKKRKIS